MAFIFAGCGFPFHTKQARDARKIARQRAAIAIPDTAVVDSASLMADLNDSIPKPKSKKGKINNTTSPDSSEIVEIEQQETPSKKDKLKGKGNGNLSIPLDSFPIVMLDSNDFEAIVIENYPVIALGQDSTELDSIARSKVKKITYSSDSVSMPIQYEATDSIIYDIASRKIYMYGNAEVYYEQYELKAGYIEFDFLKNVAMATCLIDSAGNEVECPVFDDKLQKFSSRRIEFNFKTKKGKVYDASTQQGDGFLVSNSTKFITSSDSTSVDNIIYSQGALYTTCDHPNPHFGIRASKAKIIPNKLIVIGPAFLEIMGSPTPIILPFGFFPLTQNKRSGLILSPDIDFSPALGPGLRGNGFYLGFSDYWDLQVTGDFYLRGSLRGYVSSNYNVKYKGTGNVTLGYTRIQTDEPNTPDYTLAQSFNIGWTHNQSAQAHPSQTFTANVNFGTSDYFSSTYNDAQNVLQANINSRISYTKRFIGTPFSISANFSHTQNTSTRAMTIRFPVVSLTMNQIFPFKRKKQVGSSKWYERIGFSYSSTATNIIETSDTSFFTSNGFREALDNMEYNIVHNPRVSMSFKAFKFINIRPNINYSQNWYFYRSRQYLDPTPVLSETGSDTTQFGSVETYKDYGFFTTHNFSAGINLNTQIFATGDFNVLGLHQLRGTFTPDVGFEWRPDYEGASNYYFDSVQTDTRYPDQLRRYNYFGYSPPTGRTANLTYGLNARFDAKINKSKRDTLTKGDYKKVSLIPNMSMNGSYNLAADSLHFSPINFNTYTTLFGRLDVRFSATFDPYAANKETNARINTFEFDESKRFARMTSMSFNASTSFNAADFQQIFGKKDRKPDDDNVRKFELINNVAIDYNFIVNNRYINGIDTSVVVANQLSFSGTVNLSKGWNIRVGSIGYDFTNKRITYPDFTFSRDLHCWTMGLSWQPERQTWSFYLKVKPGTLGFLNVPVQKQFYERF